MSRCGCSGAACGCVLTEGAGITITGSGSAAFPFVISGGGGGGGACPTDITVAALVALETAGTLDPCAIYRVTDWTTGPGTSLPGPNFVYARAASATELRSDVEVYVPSMEQIGAGYLGPNRGSMLWELGPGTMTRLSDALGNDVSTVGGGTLSTFPWGNPGIAKNVVTETNFTGTPSGSFTISGNTLRGGNFDFTGANSLQIVDCDLGDASITVSDGGLFMQNVIMQAGSVQNTGAGNLTIDQCFLQGVITQTAGSGFISGTDLRGGPTINLNGAAGASIQGCQFLGGMVFTVNVTGIAPSVANSVFRDASGGFLAALTIQGAASHSITGCDIALLGGTCTLDGSGTVILADSKIDMTSAISRPAGATGFFQIAGSQVLGNACTITASVGAGQLSVSNCILTAGTHVIQGGPGNLNVLASQLDSAFVTTAVGAVRNFTVQNCTLKSSANVNYNRTAAPAGTTDALDSSEMNGGILTWAGATNPATPQSLLGLIVLGSVSSTGIVNVTNPATNTPIVGVLVTESTLNVVAGGSIQHARVAGGFILGTGAFAHNFVTAEGNFAQTLTAANTNTYRGFGANTLV